MVEKNMQYVHNSLQIYGGKPIDFMIPFIFFTW